MRNEEGIFDLRVPICDCESMAESESGIGTDVGA